MKTESFTVAVILITLCHFGRSEIDSIEHEELIQEIIRQLSAFIKENSTVGGFEEGGNFFRKEEFYLNCTEDVSVCDGSCAGGNGDASVERWSVGCDKSKVRKPENCRCDYPTCLEYGDCCWNVLVGQPRQTGRELGKFLKCKSVLEKNQHAWMVSKCGDGALEQLATLCSIEPDSGNELYSRYSYLIDLPVYSEITKTLYKNTFCALCHGENNSALVEWHTYIKCSQNMTDEQRNDFIENATYTPATRTFYRNGKICQLRIHELNGTMPGEEEPNIRYCFPTTGMGHSCPPESKDAKLCNSYTQYVTHQNAVYKNIHCARCSGVSVIPGEDVSDSGSLEWDTSKYTCGPVGPFLRTAPRPGIQLLFDFALEDSEHVVGYRARCREGEIWDYLHQRCQIGFCGPGYYFLQDACHELKNESGGQSGVDEGYTGRYENFVPEEVEIHKMNGSLPSSCRRILLHKGEYAFVSAGNDSIIVNGTLRSGKVHVFHREDYEYANDTTLMICDEKAGEKYEERFPVSLIYVSTICLAISVFFSFLHIFIYLSLPKLRNLPGKILVSLTFCIFSSQLVFLTLVNHSAWEELCVLVSIFLHYTFLASFFWMNVMSFDIWRTFTGTMIFTRNQSHQGKQVTFFKYSLFAWLTPLIIVICSASLDFIPPLFLPELRAGSWTKSWEPSTLYRSHSNSSHSSEEGGGSIPLVESVVDFLSSIKPSYGQNGLCWFRQRLSLFLFFALPVALVVTSNLILFAFTAKAIVTQHRVTERVLNTPESKKRSKKISTATTVSGVSKGSNISSASSATNGAHHDEINVKLYAKLALIMGLTWILGFVSNASESGWLWFLFVILNGLQGTFIFFSFDCKKKIFFMMKERWSSVHLCGRCSSKEAYRQRTASDSTKTSNSISFNRTLSTMADKKDNMVV